jgi:predicted GIY-YIG superfamily endonuclease
MMQRAQTIQIFLPHGDPRGIRIAEITTRIVQVLEVPRSQLTEFLKLPESEQVAVYFLVSAGSDIEDPKAYIGQTSDMRSRFARHNQEKDFWQRALVLISRTHSLTQTHALFLEWLCIQEAKTAGRYSTTNGTNGSRPHTPAPLEADCYEIFDTARTLLSTLGHPLFEPAKPDVASEPGVVLLFLKGSSCDGRGYYTEEGFVLLEGSSGRSENVQSIKGTADERFRERLIENGTLLVKDDRVIVTKDHIFGSPSMAAVALMGRTANGWNEWKNAEGKSLHELKRVSET